MVNAKICASANSKLRATLNALSVRDFECFADCTDEWTIMTTFSLSREAVFVR